MANIALILAGGAGTRMKQDIPKQFLTVNERPILIYTLEAFQNHPLIDEIAVVCIEAWEPIFWSYVNQFNVTKVKYVVSGGENRQESIQNGLNELEKHHSPDDIVLIHDAIRPLVSSHIISDAVRVAEKYGSAVPAIRCTSAIAITDDGIVSRGSYPREQLREIQNPHTFRLGEVADLYRRASKEGIRDSVSSFTLKIQMGEQVHFSDGSPTNIKLTVVEDIDRFKALLTLQRSGWLK